MAIVPIHDVLPWGRSYDEYLRMFALDDRDLNSLILGCGDGPAAFNAVAAKRGARVVSVDPLYAHGAGAIRRRIDDARDTIVANTRANAAAYVWKAFPSIEALVAARLASMETFLADYEAGRREGRYVLGSLPSLPFPPKAFGLALCSHFLFTYSEQMGLDAHVAGLLEMARVATEVRVFPLLDMHGRPSPHVAPVLGRLREHGHRAEIVAVDYEFQIGGIEMLRIRQR